MDDDAFALALPAITGQLNLGTVTGIQHVPEGLMNLNLRCADTILEAELLDTASSVVIVAHFTPTPCRSIAFAASMVTSARTGEGQFCAGPDPSSNARRPRCDGRLCRH